MSLTAPYCNAMRIGQGFNTYTQEIRLQGAVQVGKVSPDLHDAPLSPPTTPYASGTGLPLCEPPAVKVNGQQLMALDAHPTPAPSPLGTPRLNPTFGTAADVLSAPALDQLPFDIPAGPAPTTSQSVTYSTRAIENVSDIMDALNISTSMSIKYGTIHGNGNASFVNENKVLDSELNYVVSVMVNNDAQALAQDMVFQEIPGLPLDRFTEVYGDAFISGFTTGGEFNAVISIKLNDKSKYKSVKQAIDVQLAVGPPTLEVGGSEAIAKEHSEALRSTEVTISVNWTGGGEVKKPGVPWTIPNVVAVANAFPSMVARSSARTQANLTKYTSLRSFQTWKWTSLLRERDIWEKDPKNQIGAENNKDGKQGYEAPTIILNYVPCSLYTAELFDALMSYKKIWKQIGDMLTSPGRYKLRSTARPATKAITAAEDQTPNAFSPLLTKGLPKQVSFGPDTASASPLFDSIGMERTYTFAVGGTPDWNLTENNTRTDPIPPEPIALNEARLLCRVAMTLITEEAARLVDHPHLAYAAYDALSKSTRMKRPNYAYPQCLAMRLPVPVHDDTHLLSSSGTNLSTDGAYLKTAAFIQPASDGGDDLWFEHGMLGDAKLASTELIEKFGLGAKYEDFSTLEMTEASLSQSYEGRSQTRATASPLRRLALHPHRLSSLQRSPLLSTLHLRAADNAIGCIGLSRVSDPHDAADRDGCNHHLGHWHHHHLLHSHSSGATVMSTNVGSAFHSLDLSNVRISRVEVAYVPGTGYIAGLTLYDVVGGEYMERLGWRMWEHGTSSSPASASSGGSGSRKEPQGLKRVVCEPPSLAAGDGTASEASTEGRCGWKFVGLAGSWVDVLGKGKLLGRVSGVWRRVAA